ncbi:Uncharacterised protein [Yersinia enterocolitica]|nr:Uncharacterised protein [Yersinia enterocolitica]
MTISDNLAVADFNNTLRLIGDFAVVGDDDNGVTGLMQAMQDPHQLLPTCAIQSTGRFVGQNNACAIHQGTSDTHPLLLPTG